MNFKETIKLAPKIDNAVIKAKVIMIRYWLSQNCYGGFDISVTENIYNCVEEIIFNFSNEKDAVMFKLSPLYERLITEHAI